MARTPRIRRANATEHLPGLLRTIRIAELLFFPVIGFMLLGLPVPHLENRAEVITSLILLAEAVAAVAVHVGLGRRRLWAWLLAMVLAAWVLTGITRAGHMFDLARLPGNTVMIGSLVLLSWTLLAQLVVLVCCVAFIPRRGELR
jgi:hypothetical protein